MLVFSATSQSTGENNSCVHKSAQTFEKPHDAQNGYSLGGSVVENDYDDGCYIKGLGSNGVSHPQLVHKHINYFVGSVSSYIF